MNINIEEGLIRIPGLPGGYVDLKKKSEIEDIPFEILKEGFTNNQFGGMCYIIQPENSKEKIYAVKSRAFAEWLSKYKSAKE